MPTLSDAVILDTRHSPAARLRQIPVSAVTLTDAFWEPRLKINREITLPSQFQHLEDTGALDNFRRASGRKTGLEFQGMWFSDSDVYKWLEGASWALASGDSPALKGMVDTAVEEIVAAQQPDGYLNTNFMFERASERWATLNLGFNNQHELYCAGHLFQAAVAHYRVTGSTQLLDVATRFADLICDTFGPGAAQLQGVDGHPEVEMPLVELSRITGNKRYLAEAEHQLDSRLGMGRMNGAVYPYLHYREYARMEGHAVCGVYLAAGATDVYSETGEGALKDTLDRLWDNMTQAQMYVTGGIGSRWQNEDFGADYEQPARAYAETCAAIGSLMWNARMLLVDGGAKYADLMERILFNGFLSGLSLSGTEYFYQNPMADDGRHRREAWFGCACCPPNVARLLAQLPGYFYGTDAAGAVYVHLYADSRAALPLPDGRTVSLTQTANYPWDGTITLTLGTAGPLALHLRVPGWADGATLAVNGQSQPAPTPGTYACIERDWAEGDTITLSLPLPVRREVAHPRATSQRGQAVLGRGPLMYCFEAADNPDFDLRDIHLPAALNFAPEFLPDLLNGVTVLHGDAPAPVTAIPYYAWANREPGLMAVWSASDPAA